MARIIKFIVVRYDTTPKARGSSAKPSTFTLGCVEL